MGNPLYKHLTGLDLFWLPQFSAWIAYALFLAMSGDEFLLAGLSVGWVVTATYYRTREARRQYDEDKDLRYVDERRKVYGDSC